MKSNFVFCLILGKWRYFYFDMAQPIGIYALTAHKSPYIQVVYRDSWCAVGTPHQSFPSEAHTEKPSILKLITPFTDICDSFFNQEPLNMGVKVRGLEGRMFSFINPNQYAPPISLFECYCAHCFQVGKH